VNLTKFIKAKCKVLHMGRVNPKHKYRLGGEWMESCPEEKDLGMLADKSSTRLVNVLSQPRRPTIPWAASPAAWAQGEGGDSAPLPRSGETPPGVLRPALEPSAQERPGAVGVGPEEAPAMIQGLEPLCWEERLGEPGLLSLGKGRLRGDLRAGASDWRGLRESWRGAFDKGME